MADLQGAIEARLGDGADVAELTNEYELRGELGRGGTAIVYRARDRALRREVAIKVVSRRAGQDDAVARLAREARTVAQLQHPNIVSVYAVRRLRSGGLALVMQYVPGTTLKDLVQTEGPLPADRAERIMRDVAQALAYAHARGVVHRDVKPENIFVDADTGNALLADFGIARSAQQEQLTMTGTALGTPSYMSPEQVSGDPLDGRSDLYSLGLVTWEMLTGRRPWDGESLYSVIHKQKHEELPPVEALRPGEVPLRLQYLVDRMLQKRAAARWAGADGLLAQLNHAVLPSDFGKWQAAMRPRVARWRERELAREREEGRDLAARAALNASTVQFRRNPDGLPETPALGGDAGAGFARDVARARRARESNEADTAAVTFDAAGNPVAMPVAAVPVGDGVVVDAPVGKSAPVDAGGAPLAEESVQYDVAEPDAAEARDDALARELRRRVLLVAAAVRATPAVGVAAFVWREPLQQALGVAPAAPAGPPSLADAAAPPGESAPAEGYPVGASSSVFASGARHSCVLTGAGVATCWGANQAGQLGDGTERSRGEPAPVVGDLTLAQLSAGRAHTCATTTDGHAYCWGADDEGQLGDAATAESRTAPVPVEGGVRFASVHAGGAHSCGLTFTGNVWCWGANARGQLGGGGDAPRHTAPVPVPLPEGTRAAALALGRDHSCALSTDGRAFCWGANDEGQLGDGSREDRRAPRIVSSVVPFQSLAAGRTHTCGSTSDRRVACWGSNEDGQLGVADARERSTTPAFAALPGTALDVHVDAGARVSCALASAGEAWCWGRAPV
ncbi:protein kinase, partial [Roseisolibacter sp. H3M3-2]|uniref:RCC1 domain-containing protein n=1 Tax=Roseisolibacter sp. H3M3-2 TaxID=3031323 RepID=UPI0023D9BCCC